MVRGERPMGVCICGPSVISSSGGSAIEKKADFLFLFICQSEKLFLSPENHSRFLLPCSEMFWSSELGGHRQKQRSCSAGLCIPLKQNKVLWAMSNCLHMGTLSEITCIFNYLVSIRSLWSQTAFINLGEVMSGWRLCPEAMWSVPASLMVLALRKQFCQ